ncbi:hypothetical protein QAD02_017610 [Eretmocerus hayati]|uniref:Uncharacterized protein n=1 Tax=Eretmocerus hayati TaxID=131215 RepID=A0ACC2PEB8_9HYME|nr:hypothetical protein QAD02_017610 [Eretmocerus hayati]
MKTEIQELKNTKAGCTARAAQGCGKDMKAPPPSDKYVRDRAEISGLEQSTIELTAEAINVMKDSMDSSKEQGKDVSLIAIKRALSKVPASTFLECINGIQAIIDSFLKDA